MNKYVSIFLTTYNEEKNILSIIRNNFHVYKLMLFKRKFISYLFVKFIFL